MQPEHWAAVRAIYIEGMETGNATFQTEAPSFEEWNSSHAKECRIVALDNSIVAGWIAITKISGRCVYAGVAEISIYISKNY